MILCLYYICCNNITTNIIYWLLMTESGMTPMLDIFEEDETCIQFKITTTRIAINSKNMMHNSNKPM